MYAPAIPTRGSQPGYSDRLIQLIVFAGYLLSYVALKPISDAHWAVRTGLRLSCLFLLPCRYWPALLFAEAFANAAEILPYVVDYGAAFGIVRSIPPILLTMPVVAWCRHHLRLFPARGLVSIKVLMFCVVVTSIATSAYAYIAITFIHDPTFKAKPIMVLGYFIGNYIAILGVVPLVLMVRLDYQPGPLRAQLSRIVATPLAIDLCTITLPAIAVLSVVSLAGSEDLRHIVRMSMFLPVSWLTLQHGWRAAVSGGALAIVATCLLTASRPDPQILETQAFIALAITCLIATGARISIQLQQEQWRKQEDANALALARHALQAHELRRRELSQSMEKLALTLQTSHMQMRDQVQHFLPRAESELFMRQIAEVPQFISQMADSLHPLLWRERGLPAAFNGTIAQALEEAGIAYQCDISGRGYTRMSPGVLSAAYRMACEAVVLAITQLVCSRVHLTVRGGETRGSRWLVVRVEGFYEGTKAAGAATVYSRQCGRIARKLGALMLNVDQMRDWAQLFRGQLHYRSSNEGGRITLFLHDMQTDDYDMASPALRLWVH